MAIWTFNAKFITFTSPFHNCSYMSPQHIHRLTKSDVLHLNEMEYHITAGRIVIYNDTALEKFVDYSKENYRAKKNQNVDG